jgi:hypothetical protein
MIDTQKLEFLKSGMFQNFKNLNENSPAQWGKMNAIQMIEHLTQSVYQSIGKEKIVVITPEENLPKMKLFLQSEKEFRPNTPNVNLPETPVPAVHSTIDNAIQDLEIAMYKFFERYAGRENETENHFSFGALNYEEWILLLYKHVVHHQKQFSLI